MIVGGGDNYFIAAFFSKAKSCVLSKNVFFFTLIVKFNLYIFPKPESIKKNIEMAALVFSVSLNKHMCCAAQKLFSSPQNENLVPMKNGTSFKEVLVLKDLSIRKAILYIGTFVV